MDSLIHFLNNDKIIKNDSDRYRLMCEIAENSINVDTCLYYSEQAIKLSEKIRINPSIPLMHLGSGYLRSGKLALALENFMQAATMHDKDKNYIGLAVAYSYIANTYSCQQNYANSVSYLKKAIVLFKNERDTTRMSLAQHNLGYDYYKTGEYDSALYFFNACKVIYKKLGNEQDYAYCLGNSGLVYSKLMENEHAEALLIEAIEILNKYGDEYGISEFMIEYAYILERLGKTNEAIEYAIKSYLISDKNKLIESKRDAAYRLSKLFGQISQYDSAFYYQSMFISLSDSLKNLESIQKMADLRTEFEISQKQKEVDILQKKKTIQLIIIGGLTLILLLASGIIFLYYSSLKRVRKFTVALDDRRKMLEKQSAELKELNKIKDKFFSIISHDLRGPISSIGGISTLIKESMVNNTPESLNELADYIDQTVVSLSGLLENLLNWAQSQQGQIPCREEKIDTKELISEIVRLFSSVAISKNIKFKLSLQRNLILNADRNSLMVILRNLISNAIKFTEIMGTIKISSGLTSENKIKIEIEDTGIGISEDKLKAIFDLKDNKSTWGTDREKGFGLGLTLVNEFVKLNKGTIDVKSIPGKGTTFILFFPS